MPRNTESKVTKVTATTNSAKPGWIVTVVVDNSTQVQTPFGLQSTSSGQYYTTKVELSPGGNLAQPPLKVDDVITFDLDDYDVVVKEYLDGGEQKKATWLFLR
jgi:hypothetical protein